MSHLAVWIALGLAAGLCVSGVAAAQTACGAKPLGAGTLASLPDAKTLRLADGREFYLLGIEVWRGSAKDPAFAQAARALLQSFVASHMLHFRGPGTTPDRYGRLHALVFPEGSEHSLQEELLQRGLAILSPRAGDEACVPAFQAAEKLAREQRLGLWADRVYGIRAAAEPSALLAERGRFAIIEGKVLSVRESGGMIYLNFGRRWTEDFTVGILKRNEHAFAGRFGELKGLKGRDVRVRGWIEQRGGPWISAAFPNQIEVTSR